MRIEGSFEIGLPRSLVWQRIKDPSLMAGCIPGCQNINQIDDRNYSATVAIKVGIISASFDLSVEVTREEEPSTLHSRTKGQEGSRASMISTDNVVTLTEINPKQTRLDYASEVMVSGRLGKYGLGMMRKTVDRMADEFAANFNRAVTGAPLPLQGTDNIQDRGVWMRLGQFFGFGVREKSLAATSTDMNDDQLYFPQTLNEALSKLSSDQRSMPISGGATLVAMLNADLISPSGLVSLKAIPELAGLTRLSDGAIRIGAMSRHVTTASSELLLGSLSGVRDAASKIANPTVRNMGTMGGSISFADPAADYAPALVAADAEIEIASNSGLRRVSADGFFVDWYQSALRNGEIVQAILLPEPELNALAHHEKFARVEGDFATVSINVVLKMNGDTCDDVHIAVGACGPKPVRNRQIEKSLIGTTLSDFEILKAGSALADLCEPIDDMRGSASYRLKLVPQLLCKAIGTMLSKPAMEKVA